VIVKDCIRYTDKAMEAARRNVACPGRHPLPLVNFAHQKEAENEGEKENEFQENEGQQHRVVDLLSGLRLSCHTLQATVRPAIPTASPIPTAMLSI